jgi:hypothetical protein
VRLEKQKHAAKDKEKDKKPGKNDKPVQLPRLPAAAEAKPDKPKHDDAAKILTSAPPPPVVKPEKTKRSDPYERLDDVPRKKNDILNPY